MSNISITIGFTGSEPDQQFVQQAQMILKANEPATTQCRDKRIQLVKLTEHNTEHFLKSLLPSSAGKNAHMEEEKNNNARAGGTICQNTFVAEEYDTTGEFLILDITSLYSDSGLANTLCEVLKTTPCTVLLMNSASRNFKNIILKYDGTDASILSILSFYSRFPVEAKDALSTTLISPQALKKSQLTLEKQFVHSISSHYDALGFIKLPFYTVKDFLGHSVKNNVDLLVLSRDDLDELQHIFSKNNYGSLLSVKTPSIFMNTHNSPSDYDHLAY